MRWAPLVVTLFLVFGASDASAQERALRWSRLAVTAHLDADGRLHVEERQSIVFNGDWNGAERDFPTSLETEFNLDRISRVDESGARVPLRKDDSLAAIDDYALIGSLLRWRSRLPSDPPFHNREITYVLDYKYGKVLVPGRESYLLDHNFGLPDLEWPIDQFSVDLTLDPAWQAVDPLAAHIARANVQGENVTVTARLRHTGRALPAAVNFGAPAPIRYALLALLLAGAALVSRQFWRRERALGRFEPLVDPASIDREWLEKHVLCFPPEVVGSTWDDRTGAAEVAALIARLVQEKKLSSRVEDGDELVLTLLCERESLDGYEAALVKSLFIAGDTTSTSKIKKHYKSSGFDPVSKIRTPIGRLLGKMPGSKGAPKVEGKWTALWVVTGLILLAFGGFEDALNLAGAFVAGAVVILLYLVAGLGGAINYRRQLSNLQVRTLQFVPAVLLILAVAAALLLQAGGLRFNPIVVAGIALLSLALVQSLFNLAKSRDAGERLENRRRMAAARGYFARELRGPNPALDNNWFPYVLAFGLSADADKWFRSFGGAASSSSRTTFDSSTGSSWGSTSSRDSGWTGFGGGASGGAGASGAWAVAATSMAAGVSSPSSSSSGGSSSGGGGGSSGGGGGGGW